MSKKKVSLSLCIAIFFFAFWVLKKHSNVLCSTFTSPVNFGYWLLVFGMNFCVFINLFACALNYEAQGPYWKHQLDYDDMLIFLTICSCSLKLSIWPKEASWKATIPTLSCKYHMEETPLLFNFWGLAPKITWWWLIACSEYCKESFKTIRVTKT